ncbi:MAG: Holliday junction resolvase RuvX [Thiotrichales bacterium]
MPDASAQKALAIDYGRKRIGIALGIRLSQSAIPLAMLENRSETQVLVQLDALVNEWQPEVLVLGEPTNSDGTAHPMSTVIAQFGSVLRNRYNLPLIYLNEAYSSFEANQRLKQLRQQGRRRKIAKHEIDQQAAAILAESWLNHHD